MFPLPNRVQYFPVFVNSSENFFISNFVKPPDLCLFLNFYHEGNQHVKEICSSNPDSFPTEMSGELIQWVLDKD